MGVEVEFSGLKFAIIIFQAVSVIAGALSAGAWAWSAYLARGQPGGWDNDAAVTKSTRKQAKWNALGATFAAISVFLQALALAISTYIEYMNAHS
ncbi:hypothetical protein [Microvirga sp. M2]|uniref:hypothetical protein n=1 Tax=Microvirga sp. M2 TaxID=3073270 RepID=UPI0039C07FFF